MIRAVFHGLVQSGVTSPEMLLNELNSFLLTHLRRVKMMSCFAGAVRSDGTLFFSNAGQAFPFLLSKAGAEQIKQVGFPLGASKKRSFKLEKLLLNGPCQIVLFSDGIIEAMNPEGEMFGYTRLVAMLKSFMPILDVEEFYEQANTQLQRFTRNAPWEDDVTLAVLEYKPNQIE